MEIIGITLNGLDVLVPAGTTILEAAKQANIEIPTLCYLKDCNAVGACRMCVVEIEGAKGLKPACVTVANQGMSIWTDSEVVLESRRRTLDLICKNHRMDCEYCVRYSDCELHALVRHYGLDDRKFMLKANIPEEDTSAVHLIRDYSKCVQCRRCVSTCDKLQATSVIGILGRGNGTRISPPLSLAESDCVSCGQCIVACPTGALREKDDTQLVWNALRDYGKHVIAIVAPFVGERLGEAFESPDIPAIGKTIAALRRLGFDRVFDISDSAASAAQQEAEVLKERLTDGKKLPVISSASCPAAVRLCEYYYPALSDCLSGCRSPREAAANLCKNEYATRMGINPADMVVVCIDACTAAKSERQRAGSSVDVVLTTRELSAMIKRACISRFTARKIWNELPDEEFDAYPFLAEGFTYPNGSIRPSVLQGLGKRAEIKSVTITGLATARSLLDKIESGTTYYDYVEILACPNGCSCGGGQPRQN